MALPIGNQQSTPARRLGNCKELSYLLSMSARGSEHCG